MKSNDFLSEGIVEDAHEMHQDHEVQMAREECYHAAGDAIALHKLLKHISEQQGIEGWVAAKVTLAADYLKTVREYLEYELMNAQSQQGDAVQEILPVAEGVITADDFKTITEVDPHNFDSDEDYYAALKAKPKAHHAPVSRPRSHPEDTDYFDPVERRLRADRERVAKAWAAHNAKKDVGEARVGNRMSDIEIGSPKIVHYKGKAVGEVGLDHEASPGNGPFYMKHYLTGKDMVGYDTKKEALADLKHLVMQHEGLAEDLDSDFNKISGEFSDEVKSKTFPGLYDKSKPGNEISYKSSKAGAELPDIKSRTPDDIKGAAVGHVYDKMKQIYSIGDAVRGVGGYKAVKETSAGSIAGVVNPTPKNKAKTGTLFGGTYKQKKAK